jgi:ATP-dependent Clp protease ATP-binding subunit ClpA
MFTLSDTLQHAMRLARYQARQHGQGTYGGGHVLYGLLDEDTELTEVFYQLGKEVPRLRSWAEFRIEHYPKASKIIEEPTEDRGVMLLLKEADRIRLKDNEMAIQPVHALEALCMPDIVFTAEQLRRFPITIDEVAAIRNGRNGGDASPSTHQKAASASAQSLPGPGEDKVLARFCENITAAAQQNKLDPVIGRERELQDIVKILGKRISPNVILVGEPGVGKTAIVNGLAQAIISKQVPGSLVGATVYELDVHGRLVAGAYKGEVEERLKKVLQAVKQSGKVILFIDEIHSLLDDRTSVGAGAINLLKPETAQGEITIIGATTQVEYKRYFEKDPAFARRFTKLEIEEPSNDLAIRMVEELVPRFETYYGLAIKKEAIPESVFLARRYFTTKRLPASAIELLDLTLSSVRILNDTSRQQLETFTSRLEAEEKNENRAAMLELLRQIQSSSSHLLFQRLQVAPEIQAGDSVESISRQLRQLLLELQALSDDASSTVGPEEVIATAAHQAKMPLGKIQTKESAKLKEIASHLQKRVVGQDHVLERVAAVLKRSRAYDSGWVNPWGHSFLRARPEREKRNWLKPLLSSCSTMSTR